MIEVKVDTRLSWSDGFYGGLLAGVVLSLFFAVANMFTHEPLDAVYLFLASAVLGKAALTGGWLAVALGIGLLFILAGIGGIVYAALARRFTRLVKTPISTLAGLVYGFTVWLIFVDVVIPTTGMQQTIDHPLWVSAAGIGIFYGSALCEYLANVARTRATRAERAAAPPPA